MVRMRVWASKFWMGVLKTRVIVPALPLSLAKTQEKEINAYENIEALPDFEWEATPQLKLRPFKPKFHLTLAMDSITASELIEMDKTYLSQINFRKSLLDNYPALVLGANQAVEPAVKELYNWLLVLYLPIRYPRMFQTCQIDQAQEPPSHLRNLVTGDEYSLQPPASAIEALKIMGQLVDEDFLFLLPSPDGDGLTLQGFVNCFPNGSSTRKRLGMKVRDLHGGVPGYKEKLATGLDKFFDRLEAGTFVKRVNLTGKWWTITDNPSMFSEEVLEPFSGADEDSTEIDMDKIFVRCERQTVYRLPNSLAIVFSIRTIQYAIKEIKGEGLGENLAQAIDGLRKGSTPAIFMYKKGPVWSKAVKEFLRDE